MVFIRRVQDVVRILTLDNTVKITDDEFSTTSFVGSPTKNSQNSDDRPSEISPKCTSDRNKADEVMLFKWPSEEEYAEWEICT